MRRFRVRIRLSFVLYLFAICACASVKRCMAVLFSLIIHECGHCLCIRICKERIASVEFTPFGGMIERETENSACKGVKGCMVACSGPLANYLALQVLSSSFCLRYISSDFIRELLTANLSMIVLNMLPILPLDGGQALFSIGYYLFPVAKLISILTRAGAACGCAFILLAGYGCFRMGILNCSLLIIGFYLFAAAEKCRIAMMTENAYTVIQEKLECINRIRRAVVYHVPGDMPVLSLIPYLDRAHAVDFVIDGMMPPLILDEKAACHLILDAPSLPILKACQQKNSVYFHS